MILFSFKEMVLLLQASSNITDTSQSERGTRVNSRGSGSKLKVSLLASEWSSSMGGLSTSPFNWAGTPKWKSLSLSHPLAALKKR